MTVKQDSTGVQAVLTGAAGVYVELRNARLTGFLQVLRDPFTDLEIEDELRLPGQFRWLVLAGRTVHHRRRLVEARLAE